MKIADNFKWGAAVPFAEAFRPPLLAQHQDFAHGQLFRGILNCIVQLNFARHAFSRAFAQRHARPLHPSLFNHRRIPRTAPRRLSPPPLLHQQPPLHQQPDFFFFLTIVCPLTPVGAQAQRGCVRLDDEV